MFKNKIPILAKGSLSLLFQVRLHSPSFLAYSLRLPLRNPGSLHENFAPNALTPPPCLRWLSTATQRNDFPPGHYAHQESASEPHYNSRPSFPTGMYQDPDGYRSGEVGGTPTYCHERLNYHGSGIHGESSSSSNRCDTSNAAAHVYQMNATDNECRSKHEFSVNSDGYNQGYSGTGGQITSAFTSQHYNGPQTRWHSQNSNVVRGHIANGESYANGKEWHRREESYQDPSGHYGERYPDRFSTYSSFSNEKYGHNPGNVQHDPNSNCLDNRAGAWVHNPSIHGGDAQKEGFSNSSNVVRDHSTIANGEKGTYTVREGNSHQSSNGVLKEMPTDILYDHAGYQRENPPVVHPHSVFSGNSVELDISESSIGSAEIGYSSRYKGTIEELDELCKEKKMKEAMEVLAILEKNGFMVDLPRYLNLIVACDDDKFIEEARKLHSHILRRFGNAEVRVNNKILDMYFKCSSTSDAFQLFDNMPHRNLTSWDTMILGLANNGHGEDAIEMFAGFKQEGLTPDGGLFVSIFYVCGCLGAIEEGLLHFASMEKDFGIAPGMEHYFGIVDMLGRAGYLEEALEFIHQMPFEPSIDIWETLMTLARLNGNLELGDLCAKVVEQLDASRLNEQSKNGLLLVKDSDLAKEKEKKKSLQLKSRIREYRAGDRSHPENDKLYAQLRCLQQQMKEAGYVPDTRFVLHDVDQESKEDALLAHSERLALSYALMTTSVRSDIKIMKNLRVCGDCHNALKIISKLVGRLIIARDAKRFHHFENGVCSCKDYW
ncbi:pentatricopeptide repeat-containing protein At4g32450, mitochondrial-like [Curcuma longa]|uniref:pentatricopeptide repeat-containing protein At4g32450, mitochondrial-like n=1 Tax=Curcuma longa TaxID=136217 RepID=UPI003D9DC77A